MPGVLFPTVFQYFAAECQGLGSRGLPHAPRPSSDGALSRMASSQDARLGGAQDQSRAAGPRTPLLCSHFVFSRFLQGPCAMCPVDLPILMESIPECCRLPWREHCWAQRTSEQEMRGSAEASQDDRSTMDTCPTGAAPQEIDLGSHVGWMLTLPVSPQKTGSANGLWQLEQQSLLSPSC